MDMQAQLDEFDREYRKIVTAMKPLRENRVTVVNIITDTKNSQETIRYTGLLAVRHNGKMRVIASVKNDGRGGQTDITPLLNDECEYLLAEVATEVFETAQSVSPKWPFRLMNLVDAIVYEMAEL
jgi:hypothetical protein